MWKMKKYIPQNPIEQCGINCKFYFKDNRRHDLSNIFESIADFLVDAGILKDDSWKYLKGVELYAVGVDKNNPRVEVNIYELN